MHVSVAFYCIVLFLLSPGFPVHGPICPHFSGQVQWERSLQHGGLFDREEMDSKTTMLV